MAQCLICNQKTELLSIKTGEKSCVCKNCSSSIPSLILKKIPKMPDDVAVPIINYYISFLKKNKMLFTPTTVYGSIALDEMNGLIAVGNPKNNNIFDILTVETAYLSMQSSEATENSVSVQVNLLLKLNYPCEMTFKDIVAKQKAVCYAKRIDSEHVSYTAPADMGLFQDTINRLYKQKLEKYNENINKTLLTKEDFEIYKARQLFMCDQDLPINYLDSIKIRLLKVFPEKADRINHAYSLLRSKITDGV